MNNSIQSTIILLIEQIVVALGGEFKLYLPQLIPHMLRVLVHDSSSTRSVSTKVSTRGYRQSSPESYLYVADRYILRNCLLIPKLGLRQIRV